MMLYDMEEQEGISTRRKKRKKEREGSTACLMVIFRGVSRALQYYLSALNRMNDCISLFDSFHGAQFFISPLTNYFFRMSLPF